MKYSQHWAIPQPIKKSTVPDSSNESQEYKDFKFRRRYDHFLHFKLLNAKPDEILQAARELGFNIIKKDLEAPTSKKPAPASKQDKPTGNKFTFDGLISLFKG